MKRQLSFFGLTFMILSFVSICTSQMALVVEDCSRLGLKNVEFKNFATCNNSCIVVSYANFNNFNNVEFISNTATHNSNLLSTIGSSNNLNSVVFKNNIIDNNSNIMRSVSNSNVTNNSVLKEPIKNTSQQIFKIIPLFAAIIVSLLLIIFPKFVLYIIKLKDIKYDDSINGAIVIITGILGLFGSIFSPNVIPSDLSPIQYILESVMIILSAAIGICLAFRNRIASRRDLFQYVYSKIKKT